MVQSTNKREDIKDMWPPPTGTDHINPGWAAVGSYSSMAFSAELHTVLRNCLIQNSTVYSYYSRKTSSWQMNTRLLLICLHSDPLEDAKGKSRGWDVSWKKASHNSNSCWSMVTSLSPPLLSRFSDDYNFMIKEPAAACHSCPEASRSSIPRKHRFFFFKWQ